MTKKEAMRFEELHIKVTPLVEDAFYAFREIDHSELNKRLEELPENYVNGDKVADNLLKKFENDVENSEKAMVRLRACKDPKERLKAIMCAYQMMANQQKYGYPCIEWWPD